MYIFPNTEVPRSVNTPLYVKKEQKINDRLQDKINILKTQTNNQDTSRIQSQQQLAKDINVGAFEKKMKDI